jgi:Tol biopolymer transport system component
MSQWLQFSRLPRALLWIATLLVIALATLGKPASWAAPVAHPPNQTVPTKQLTHMPMIGSPLIRTCDFYLYACKLTAGYADVTMIYDWSPDGRTIAFYGTEDYGAEDGASGLYTMNEQGKNRRLLLNMSRIETILYSPDGEMIALIVSRPGSLSNSGPANGHILHDIYVYTLATGQVRSLSDPTNENFSDVAPNWSPDSSTLAFTRIQHDSATGELTKGDIYTIRPDGSQLIQLTDTPQHEHLPTYSPDGTRIAYISVKENSNNPSIAVMEANGDEPTILTSDEAFFANDPFWAADGNSIFFFGATENYEWDIYKIGTDGGDPVNLTHDALKQSNPLLSPDGKQIFFVGRVETHEVFEIDFYTMNTDGSNITKYPNPHGTDRHPSGVKWHPDGQLISYAAFTGEAHLYLLRLGAGSR